MSYSIPIKLSKEFMMKVHAHPLVAEIEGLSFDDPFYQSMWQNQPQTIKHNFSGLNYEQFQSGEEIVDFLQVFSQVLTRHKIDSSHRNNLLYLIEFYNQEQSKGHLKDLENNYLQQTGEFLIKLFLYGYRHFAQMKKAEGYFEAIDLRNGRTIFFTKSATESKNVDDYYDGTTVKYHEFTFGSKMLRVPYMNVSLNSDTDHFQLPDVIKYEAEKLLIENIINEHKEQESEYYKFLSDYGDDVHRILIKDFNTRPSFSIDTTIVKVGTLVQDYLHSFYPRLTKVDLAGVLWEYFALFKVYKIKSDITPPSNYSELSNFYKNQKIDKQMVRNKFKDAPIKGFF
jgi:hypothetical protein